jgi:hypothetical protein
MPFRMDLGLIYCGCGPSVRAGLGLLRFKGGVNSFAKCPSIVIPNAIGIVIDMGDNKLCITMGKASQAC